MPTDKTASLLGSKGQQLHRLGRDPGEYVAVNMSLRMAVG